LNPEKEGVTGIILAGGRSRRLGYKNKALMKVGGRGIIEYVISALLEVTENIIIITNLQDEFVHLRLPIYRDIIPESGSLGGIYTGLGFSETDYNLVLACDMPFIRPHLLRFILNRSEGYDVAIPITPDGHHPTCAVYRKSCIEAIKSQINESNLKISDFFRKVRVNKIEISMLNSPNMLFNINTEEDYLQAISIFEKRQSQRPICHNIIAWGF
jgi:molybdopterin-guanine dinucleotide biosynthesis protein A